MLARALNLREAIDEFCQDFEDLQTSHADDILTNKDWEVISDIKGFLEKLAYSTKALESPETCIDLTCCSAQGVYPLFLARRHVSHICVLDTKYLRVAHSKVIQFNYLHTHPIFATALLYLISSSL